MALILTSNVISTPNDTPSNNYSQDGYKKITYEDFINLLTDIAHTSQDSSIFKISNAFEDFKISDIPACSSDLSGKCSNPLIEITNFENGEKYVKSLPTILLIAGFHGDEVIGTQALFYLIRLIKNNYKTDKNIYALLQKTRILVLPMANVNGFEGLKREETVTISGKKSIEVDPNRDFSYNIAKKGRCFQTTTARVIDSIFRNNLIISAITFHGGDNSISYPWGNFAHSKHPYSQDDSPFRIVANVLKTVAGGNDGLGIKNYKTGTMQRVVYDVNGGFEDWAYGASFDDVNVSKLCALKANSFHNQKYSNSSNRAFVYLVEAGFEKNPKEATYGNELGLTEQQNEAAIWGHVTRNIQLSLKFAEITVPHIIINNIALGEYLDIDILVKGCIKLDSIDILKYGYLNYQKEYNPKLNEYRVLISIKPTEMFYPELKINVICDRNWKDEKSRPQSHLVNIRTEENYSAENNGFSVSTEKYIQAVVLNIKLNDLKSSYLVLNRDRIYSLIYTPFLEAKWDNNSLKFVYNDGHLTVSFDRVDEISKVASIRIKRFGVRGSNEESSKDNLLEFNPDDKIKMSQDYFFNLAGRAIEIYNKETNEVIKTSDIMQLNNDPESLIMIPVGGVACGSDKTNPNYFLIEADLVNNNSDLNISVHSNLEASYNFQMGSFQDEITKIIETNNVGNLSIVGYTKTIHVKSLNTLRILGQNFILFSEAGEEVFSCRLMRKDPEFKEFETMKQALENTGIHKVVLKQNSDPADWRLAMILICIFVIAAIALFVIKKTCQEGTSKEEMLQNYDQGEFPDNLIINSNV